MQIIKPYNWVILLEVFLFKTIQIGYPTRSDRNPQRASDPLYNQYKVSEKTGNLYWLYETKPELFVYQRAIGIPIAFFNFQKQKNT